MPNSIDYDFIAEREGGRRTKGYIPAAAVSKSGVTIATGFDLGARNEGDLSRLGLGKDLVAKLKPYLGKVKVEAESLLKTTPLTITDDEAEFIDKAVKKAQVDTLKTRYLAAAENTAKKDFFDLPANAQTAIASVAFQYGDLSKKTPKFWKAAAAQSWSEASDVLKSFGDAYRTRRKLEADLLDRLVPTSAQVKP
jgi:GH24 family phage-related lysozyme (muramidase)